MGAKIDYDTPVPASTQSRAEHMLALVGVINGEHKTARMEFENTKEAVKAQRNMDMYLSRKKIFTVFVTRQANVVYALRREVLEHAGK